MFIEVSHWTREGKITARNCLHLTLRQLTAETLAPLVAMMSNPTPEGFNIHIGSRGEIFQDKNQITAKTKSWKIQNRVGALEAPKNCNLFVSVSVCQLHPLMMNYAVRHNFSPRLKLKRNCRGKQQQLCVTLSLCHRAVILRFHLLFGIWK